MTWNLRYAPHLGYRPPYQPLFAASVGSNDPVDHVSFATERQFAGILYAAARMRSALEQERVGNALARHGLDAGCMLYTTFDQLRNPSWATPSADARRWIAQELAEAISAAKRLGTRRLAVLGGATNQVPIALQHAAFIENLRYAADLAFESDVVLCLETLSRCSAPGMLLEHIDDACAVVRAVDHPSVRLIFDTAHVQSMDGDLLFNLERAWNFIEVVQLADNPGRLEPGSGEINFESILRTLVDREYTGLVELEHGWRDPGLPSEIRGLETLHRLDAAATGPPP